MKRATGTYRNGSVILDQPVDWPDGTHVEVSGDVEQNGSAELSVDGSPSDDTPEGVRKWVEWFDLLEPVFTGEELQQFEANLRSARDEQKVLLPKLQEKLDNLIR